MCVLTQVGKSDLSIFPSVDDCSLDVNRERVVARNSLPTIIAQLQIEPWLALPVLKNVIVDYGEHSEHHARYTLNAHDCVDPAEDAARKHGLCPALASLLITFKEMGEDIGGLLPDICSLYDIIIDGECKF